MIHEKIDLNEAFPNLPDHGKHAVLETFCRSSIHQDPADVFPAVVVCPGGAYMGTAAHEGEPIALAMLGYGIQSFVLWYTVPDNRWPQYHLELAAALLYIRLHADRYFVDVNAISALGFSAGAHLVGSYGTLWHEPLFAETLQVPSEQIKLNGMVLCYGLLTMQNLADLEFCAQALFKEDAPLDLRQKLTAYEQVSADTPPAYIWHCADDPVPAESSLRMALALTAAKIPYELHIFPKGGHGLGLADWFAAYQPGKPTQRYEDVGTWVSECAAWMARTFGYGYSQGN